MKRFLILSWIILWGILFGCFSQEAPDPETMVTDYDGHVYKAIKIGDQIWMAENLRVTHFRNGDPIPNIKSEAVWISYLALPPAAAYCDYDNNPANSELYGRLYNWYAVDDPRGLAPSGWHIPIDKDWQILIDHLGGYAIAGGKLKEAGSSHWADPNIGATNESQFTALPGGGRDLSGEFVNLGKKAYYWSSTKMGVTQAYERFINNNGPEIYCLDVSQTCGFAVRCVKD